MLFSFSLVLKQAGKEEKTKIINKEIMSVDTATVSETIVTRRQKTGDDEKPEASNTGHLPGFSPLPLPPREHCYSPHTAMPTEDKMGSLYAAVTERNPQPSSSSSRPSDRDAGAGREASSGESPAVRFVPRTTRLETRKRKLEEDMEHFSTPPESDNEPLIGPKLPEPPRLDMEDESLNTTMNLIRNTMKRVKQCVYL